MTEDSKYTGVDTFIHGIGTVRECIDCGALIAGGPTRCKRCAIEGAPRESWHLIKKLMRDMKWKLWGRL